MPDEKEIYFLTQVPPWVPREFPRKYSREYPAFALRPFALARDIPCCGVEVNVAPVDACVLTGTCEYP